MGLFLEHRTDTFQLGIWKIDESIEELLTLLPCVAKYKAASEHFTSMHRQMEWLAVRVLLYTLLGEEKEIVYVESGKPYLKDNSYYISISHTRGYVAVILSFLPVVGIDIERSGERVRKVAHKFMRDDEVLSFYNGTDLWSMLLHWSAKEVMFKCLDKSEVDFRRHLQISPFQVEEHGTFEAQEYRTTEEFEFNIHYLIYPEFVLTWQCSNNLKI